MLKQLYNTSLLLYLLSIRIYSWLGNEKAKKWIKGRKTQVGKWEKEQSKEYFDYWFHCASLGEFEQARPIIELLSKQDKRILLSFFSPSGYEIRKDYLFADRIIYLPYDYESNVHYFFKKFEIGKAIWVKYDFWWNYFETIKKRGIPLFLIAFYQPKNTSILKQIMHKKILPYFNAIFTQDKASTTYIKGIDKNIVIHQVGDPRIDRAMSISKEKKTLEKIEQFVKQSPLIVGGSCYDAEMKLLSKYLNNNKKIKLVIAPPEISDNFIRKCLQYFPEAILYSKLNKSINSDCPQTLIMDNVGFLGNLYSYAKIAVIGGGFGKGIHNILEPACHGVPSIFGPNYTKFKEAAELIKTEGAFSFKNKRDFDYRLNILLNDSEKYKHSNLACKQFIAKSTGASKSILQVIN